ncbi:cytochrome P450 [Cynara cardunculus var. scolymus]|uniref:Cytochrome P450 n=2 Tax=Cynara cardunculus var. scolymus TaxID=59895 RepID=A0A124SCS4_CYNCS|nr:cytochrome P450 [Cynara cardunculus var. scolymus]
MPTNWPLLGMTPALLWNSHRFNDYITSILKQNGSTFICKGPWFVNMDILFTSDPANYLYISTTNFHNYPKGPEFRETFDILGDGIFGCDSKMWELHRKTTMSLFNRPDFLNMVEQTTWNHMEEKLLPVLEVMSERRSKMDLQDIFQRLTFDSIFSLVVDYDPKTLSVDLPHNKFEVAFTKSEEALFVRSVVPKCCWKLLKRFQLGNEKHLSDALKLSDEIIYKLLNEKKERQIEAYDIEREQQEDLRLLTGFMREYNDQTGSFDDHDKFIKDTILSLVFAGRDSTSATLTWFFYLLAKNPIANGKICEEIHTKLGIKKGEKWRKIGLEELQKLAYLQGALCEALRLFPAVPVNPKAPVDLDTLPSGHQVDKNTKIFLHSYAMGRMEMIWGQDCLEFKPERWLSEQGGIKHVPSHKFTTFHTGPRTCIGKKFALTQMKIVAATVIYNYDVEVVDGHPIMQNPSVILQMKYGLMVKLTKKYAA